MDEELRSAPAIVTGAAQGLGFAIARAYINEGMRVALMDVQAERLAAVAKELTEMGGDCLPIVVDLSEASATSAAVQKAITHYGTPRVLVHNAALLITRSMLEITFEDWQKEVNIILQAAFLLTKAIWPLMIEAGTGSIVYLSSGSGVRGFVEEIAYCPAKHAVEGLMKCLAMEGKPYNIAVNTATPGAPINTPMSEQNYTAEQKLRWVDPALLTPAFVFLAKQDASGLTGHRVAARAGTWEITNCI